MASVREGEDIELTYLKQKAADPRKVRLSYELQ